MIFHVNHLLGRGLTSNDISYFLWKMIKQSECCLIQYILLNAFRGLNVLSLHLGTVDLSKDYLLQKIVQKEKKKQKQKNIVLSIHIITENLTNTVFCHV